MARASVPNEENHKQKIVFKTKQPNISTKYTCDMLYDEGYGVLRPMVTLKCEKFLGHGVVAELKRLYKLNPMKSRLQSKPHMIHHLKLSASFN